MSTSFPIEEMRKLAQESAADSQAKQIAGLFDDPGIPPDALLWIALVPDRTWTLPLAEACSFPSQELGSIENTFTYLSERNIARFKAPFFTVNSSLRPMILQHYLENPKTFSILRSTLANVGQALTRARSDAPSLSPLTTRWATLAASAERGPALAEAFDDAVSAAAAEQDTADILMWMDAARPLAALLARDLDQSLELAIKRAGQRIELIHRMKADEEHLHSFFRRQEQIVAVSDLLGDKDHWALHLIGAGGVGKTMLVRHISAQMTRERDMVTARIDFDYLNADYPRLAPGLLLWSFSQQLSAFDQSRKAESSFREADDCLNKLHELLASQPGSSTRGTDHPLFRLALGFYIDGLKILGTDKSGSPRSIVLILDTCEELAKASPGGKAPINVIETFRILEALRYGVSALDNPSELLASNSPDEGVPQLRVIFSGRRLLAREGWNWRAESKLSTRSYLRLLEIRGFTEGEAKSFLLERAQVRENYVDAIIQRSKPELGRIPDLVRTDAPDEQQVPRCNPFELKLYADWASEEPPPAPEMISTASNSQYVEERILRRLGFEAPEPVFQAVALLGHFDQRMLSAISGETSPGTWERLAEQEWTDQRVESFKQGREVRRVLSVSPGVRKRLLEYFRNRWGLGAIWQRTASYLEETTLGQPLSELSWYTFDAALRVLELSPDPTRAARWWKAVERRILGERDFEWARQVTAFMQGSDGAAGPDDNPEEESALRPAVLATYAATLLHSDSKGLLGPVWDEVCLKASRDPEPEGRIELMLRGSAGRIASSRYSGAPLSEADITALASTVRDLARHPEINFEVAAAFVAAAETLVEQAELEFQSDRSFARLQLGDIVPDLARQFANNKSATLKSFACSLAGRSEALLHHYDESLRWFRESLRLTRLAFNERLTCLSWIPPSNILARVLLEFGRAAYPAFCSASEVLLEINPLLEMTYRTNDPMLSTSVDRHDTSGFDRDEARSDPSPSDVDLDRLESILLQLRSAGAPVAPFELASPIDTNFIWIPSGDIGTFSNVHFEVPSRAVTNVTVLALSGILPDTPQSPQGDLHLVQQGEAALARIAQRMRMNQNSRVFFPSLEESPRADYRALIWALNAFEGEASREPIPSPPSDALNPSVWRHAIWRTRFTLNPKKLSEVSEWISKQILNEENTEPEDILDLREARLLFPANGSLTSPNLSEDPSAWLLHPHSWWLEHKDEPERALRYWLRQIALAPESVPERSEIFSSGGSPIKEVTWQEIVERLGKCRAAEIALEEGDLLSLRLPDCASMILGQSVIWFEQCQCWTGVVISGGALALIQGRQSKTEELKETLEKIRNAYVELRSTIAELPDWTQLEIAARTNGETIVKATAWSPWIRRLTLCLAFREQLRKPASVLDVTNLYNSFKITSVSRGSYAADSLFADVCRCFLISTESSPSAVRLSIASSPDSTLAQWGQIAAGLVIIAILLYGTILVLHGSAILLMDNSRLLHGLRGSILDLRRFGTLGRWLYAAFTDTIVAAAFQKRVRPFSKYFGFMLLLLYGLAGVQLAITRWLPAEARFAGLLGTSNIIGIALLIVGYYLASNLFLSGIASGRLSIQSSSITFNQERLNIAYGRNIEAARFSKTSESSEAFEQTEQDERLFDLPFGFRLSLANIRHSTGTIETVPFSPYQKLSKFLPEDIQSGVRKLHKRLVPFRTVEIVVEPSDGKHAVSWEAMIALAINPKLISPWNIPFRFRRDPMLGHPAERPELTGVASISTTGIGEELARRTWKAPFRLRMLRASDMDASSPQPGVQLLHSIAIVEEASAGLRLRFGEVTESAKSSERSSARRGFANTVSARDIKLAFPDLALCVLQGNVSPLADERVDADRRRAGLTRTFAADLHKQGVFAVLVIPPLDEKRAALVLNAVREAVASRTSSDAVWLSTNALEQASRKAQHLIFTQTSESTEVKWERAMDVCLYCVRTTGLRSPGKKARINVTLG